MEEKTMQITKEQLAQMIDHTNLKAFSVDTDMKKLCDEARACGFGAIAVNGAQIERCKKYLEGSRVRIAATVGFPLGQMTIESKVFEAEDAIKRGADEIDYVLNVAELRNGNLELIEQEMQKITDACHARGVLCKVIFENCYLTDEEKREAAGIARRVRPDFVKTSTGFGTGGATVEDVRLMKSVVGEEVKVKAAGGIRDFDTAMEMIAAGAERLGTSAGVELMEKFR
ncbi:MAG: deoxyribose-phosphate aldolase [Eubacteriales bacterium]|nr:deoxyribose-phosphate aldolase [Eubacteriales bacterium]